jgi:hypothetical protein
MSDLETPRKVSASSVEVLSSNGETLQESQSRFEKPKSFTYVNVKVFKGGPALLLLLPLLIPVVILGLFMMTIFALFFGKNVVKVVRKGTLWKS